MRYFTKKELKEALEDGEMIIWSEEEVIKDENCDFDDGEEIIEVILGEKFRVKENRKSIIKIGKK
jgi:hypothetical protein